MSLKKDIMATIQTHLGDNWTNGSSALTPIDWPETIFNEKELPEWIRIRVPAYPSDPKPRGQDIGKVSVYLSVCVRKGGSNDYRIYELVDILEPLFHQKDIPLLAGPGIIRFREVQCRTDGNVPIPGDGYIEMPLVVDGSVENV